MANQLPGESVCPRCGGIIPSNAPGVGCPSCFASAMADAARSREAGQWSTGPSFSDRDDTTPLVPGQTFGSYRIGRLLGRGGMGEVYEAEHLVNGRRVALKILNQRLRREDDRARFRFEGELAASLSHPHVVYIFGSEEIDSIPAITMELLPGGTLKDRVKANGPLSPTEAVEAILQVIAGLEAAQAVGILHRDIKPSNCFIAHDGAVKVGDFGLSISLLPRGVTFPDEAGAFQGTPEFASPEQLRGEELNVRADIYAVGATLFYLLTGHAPFDGRDPTAVVARIAAGPAPSARRFKRAIPRELDRLVTRCLSKYPEIRPGTYAELKRELTRFTSVVSTPAPLGRRAAAGLLDAAVLLPVQGLMMQSLVGFRFVTHQGPALALGLGVPMMFYGTVAEAATGTTFGMRKCGLRVIDVAGGRPDIVRAFVHNATALIPLMLAIVAAAWGASVGESAPWLRLTVVGTFAATTGLLFVSARAQNGLAAFHDWLANTRIIQPPPPESHAAPSAQIHPEPNARASTQIGPYDVVESLSPTDLGELFLGFDPLLKRSVWIHVVQPDTLAVPATARDATGQARLHWLNGHRTVVGGFDAYEAPNGGPLMSLTEALPWRTVCRALIDLGSEIDRDLLAETPEPLNLDRVWVTTEGRMVLLDFRAPGAPAAAAGRPATIAEAQHFLHDVAARALGARVLPPLPLSVSSVLERLAAGAFRTMADVRSALSATRGRAAHVSHTLRFASLAVTLITWLIGTRVLHGIGISVSKVGGANILCALLAVFWALLLRSGFWLRIFHIAVVTPDGRAASRLRAAGRAVLAWSWVPLQILATTHGWSQAGGYVVLLEIVGLLWSAVAPTRGPHDRLAGTFLVPR
jgi:hypothetical protein